jgi:hypothetical protein
VAAAALSTRPSQQPWQRRRRGKGKGKDKDKDKDKDKGSSQQLVEVGQTAKARCGSPAMRQ